MPDSVKRVPRCEGLGQAIGQFRLCFPVQLRCRLLDEFAFAFSRRTQIWNELRDVLFRYGDPLSTHLFFGHSLLDTIETAVDGVGRPGSAGGVSKELTAGIGTHGTFRDLKCEFCQINNSRYAFSLCFTGWKYPAMVLKALAGA